MRSSVSQLYEFGPFRLDAAERVLLRAGRPVPLTPKVFDLLLVLVENRGHLVAKDELMRQVWPDSFVEEGNLTSSISILRKALAEAHEQRYIETVPRHGYRFVAGVSEVAHADSELILERHVRAQIITEEEEIVAEQTDARTPESHDVTRAGGERLRAPELGGELPARLAARAMFSIGWRKERQGPVLIAAAATLALSALAVAGYFYFVGQRGAIDSIAVLPFVNVSADPNTEYLSDGITESAINSLAQLSKLRVVPRSTVFRYKGRQLDPQQIGRELGVRAVLTGTVAQHGDTLSIQTELIDVTRDAQLWGEQYNRKLSDLLAVQAEIAQEISGKLRLQLSGEGRRLTKHGTENPEAYRLYLKGRYFWNKRTKEGVRKGIECFQQAIEADPSYALAYAGLADCYVVLGAPLNAMPPKEAFLKTKAAALKALELDETLAEAHAALGVVKQRLEWDPEGAAQEVRRAIELNPGYATAHQWYAINFEIAGRPDECIAEAKRAYELDPLSLAINARLGHCLYYARRYDQAIEQYRKTLELDPNFAIAHAALGRAYEQQGLDRAAFEERLKADALTGKSPEALAALRQAYTASGMRGYWQETLKSEQARAGQEYVSAYDVAILYARMGEKEQALAWLEKAYEERSSALVYIKVEPALDALRPDPRFVALMQRVGLAP